MIDTIITGGQYTDPTEYNGPEVDWCKHCQSNPKWEDTDVCDECIDEFDEMKGMSACCGALIERDMELCYRCKDHTESVFDEFCRENKFNPKTYKYA